MEESWKLFEWALNGGTPQLWVSVPETRPRGREFLRVGELPRNRSPCSSTCPMLMVRTELQEFPTYVPYVHPYTFLTFTWKLEQRPGFSCAGNENWAILRLHTGAVQSRDCEKCAILRLARSFRILRMRSTISRHASWEGCLRSKVCCLVWISGCSIGMEYRNGILEQPKLLQNTG